MNKAEASWCLKAKTQLSVCAQQYTGIQTVLGTIKTKI